MTPAISYIVNPDLFVCSYQTWISLKAWAGTTEGNTTDNMQGGQKID